jgi:NAD(P)-dependent dehydrogenase (short-subunit alcohol dehydrogenase family)
MTGKVAIITGASQGIGAEVVAGYRGRGWAVVASARTIKPSEDPDVLAVAGGTPAALAALTKGGLAAATRSLAIEYASRGIRVNAVSPGIIQTPVHPPESYDDLGDRLPPLGRPGQVSDVVDGILFLEYAPYITGEIVHIDGGQIAGHLGALG